MFIEAIHARARGPPLAGHFLATYIDVMDLAYFDGRFKPKQKQKTSSESGDAELKRCANSTNSVQNASRPNYV